MTTKRINKKIFGLALGVSLLSFIGIGAHSQTAYAADTSDISTESTRSEVQEIVDEGNFDYTQLSAAEIDHIYSLYNNDPETIKQLQRQSDSVSQNGIATLSSTSYTHASQFKGYTAMKGIDVSEWNGTINWKKVKASGITFAFIRAGGRYYGSGGYYTDSTFEENMKNAIAAGLDVGVYFYSQAISTAEARQEAAYTMNLVSSYNINLPIVMDYEYAWENGLTGRLYNAHLSKSAATTIINTFCSAVEAKGYVGMLYASKTVITDDMNVNSINSKYPIWNAQYNSSDTLSARHSYWQYSDEGNVPGISHATDMNFKYVKAPSAPASLAQQTSTDASITLTWNKVPEVYGYQIVRYDESQDKYVSVGTVKGAGIHTFTDKGLQDGKKYTYKVRGYYKLNSGTIYGTYSSECTGITIADNIENFKASVLSSTSVKLSWTPIAAATGYRIYRYNNATKEYDTIATTTSATNAVYTDNGLYGGTTYLYKVRAYTTTESGTIWHVLSDALEVTTDPGQVSGLKIDAAFQNYITLKWNKQNNVDGYIVFVWDSSTATWTRLGKITSAQTVSYTHKGLSASAQYSYTVCAYYTKNGKLHYTDSASAVTGTTGPVMPSNTAITGRTASSIGVRWTQISNATGYLVYMYNESTKSYERIAHNVGNTMRTFSFSGLKATSVYKFGIRAYTEKNGVTSYSNMKEFSTCTLPATFTSSFKYASLGSQRYLQWQKLTDATGYIVLKYDMANKKYTRVKKITSNQTNRCILPSLKSGFGYRVMAYKTYGGKTFYGNVSSAPVKMDTLNGTVIDSQVRLRSGAGTNHSIIKELARGSKVKVIGYAMAGRETWYKVTYTTGGKTYTGYMFADYIRIN